MSLSNDKYFCLFPNCVPVKGAARSLLCDLDRSRMDFISNTMYEMLVDGQGKSIGDIIKHYGEENEDVIQQYFEHFIEKEYIFLCDEVELAFFPPLDLTFESPSLIENAIIDVLPESEHDYSTIFQQLEDLGCIAIHLRFFYAATATEIHPILEALKGSCIESVEILVAYSADFNTATLEHWAKAYPRLWAVVIHNAPKEVHTAFTHSHLNIKWIEHLVDSKAHCGQIGARHFKVNMQLFTESQKHNTCLHRKISVDHDGAIKNCPSLPETYGNIKTMTLEEALCQKGFREKWKINKDQIEVCKDCEFRHVCTDCRAYLQDPQNQYSKPLKCGYDPYTNEWQAWSSNPLKSLAPH